MQALAQYDMNLMRTFVVVYETRSVTIAADRLFISQPSVSYALAKLRKIFSDPLFLRNRQGLEPTPTAEALYPEIVRAVQVMDSAVQSATVFEASQTTRTFRLMMTDLGLVALFSFIVRSIQELAPQSKIAVSLMDVAEIENKLRRNEIDAAIAVPSFSEDVVVRDHLMDMPYIGVCSKDHPRLSDEPSLEALAAESRIVVSDTLGHQHIEQTLAKISGGSEPVIALPNYSVVDETLAATETYCVVPLFLGDVFVKRGPVKKFKLPFSFDPGHVGLHTLRRVTPSPHIEWLRETIAHALLAYPYPKYVPTQ